MHSTFLCVFGLQKKEAILYGDKALLSKPGWPFSSCGIQDLGLQGYSAPGQGLRGHSKRSARELCRVNHHDGLVDLVLHHECAPGEMC